MKHSLIITFLLGWGLILTAQVLPDCRTNGDQWISTAKEAGFRHVILITKHHDGFCLWDSKFTEYDVASSPVKTDIVAEVAKACGKYGIKFGLYYSLWDRKEPTHNDNVLLVNLPPDPTGRIRENEREAIFRTADLLGIRRGNSPLPKAPLNQAAKINTASFTLTPEKPSDNAPGHINIGHCDFDQFSQSCSGPQLQ